METLFKDLRYGVRSLLKRPGFTAVAVITLALGIGLNSAIFSVINAVLLRPLPYDNPARLLAFRSNQSALDLADVQAQTHTFSKVGGEVLQALDYTAGSEPVQFQNGHVTGGYFETLGIKPALGRYITSDDDKAGGPFVVVLSHALWRRQFNGDPGIAGKTIPLSGNVYTIIGVMPEGFVSPGDNAESWTPVFVSNPVAAKFRGVHFLRSYGRLAPGVTVEQARGEMQLIDKNLGAQYPAENKNRNTVLIPLHDRIVGDSRLALLVLFAAVSLVLLIACANFANLLLARAAEREREFVIRAALGAGRWRLIRQLLTESLLISLAGGAVGVLLSIWATSLLVSLKPENLPRLQEIGVDLRVLGFTFALSCATGIVFGLLPAWTAARGGVSEGLKESGRTSTAGGARQRLRSTFVVVELAVALILLMGAGLLIKTFWNLRSVEPGFSTQRLVTMRIELPESRYKEVDTQMRFRSQMLEDVKTLPGVQAALISELPLSGDSLNHDFVIDNRPHIDPGDEPSLESRSVMGDYFRTMKIPLLAGRDFDSRDFSENAPLVGIANAEMVRQYFPNEDPLGKRMRWARNPKVEWITIVGVVGDVKHFGLDLPEQPGLYSPYSQAQPWKRWMTLVARTESDPGAMTQAIKRQIWKVDAQLPVTKVLTMQDVAATSFAARRFNMSLLAMFAVLALVLAAVGIYGVMSYAVTQRTQEIGIRMALGAQVFDVVKLVVQNGMALAFIGVAIGVAGAFALTRLMTTLLFGVTPTDAMTFTVVPLCLLVVALIACYLPARRAAKVDPLEALRYE
ncbi:MAG: putative transport system permease protein [Blastocatellia bacterium]|jgi:putative ABC transport system permease protein|nr:putative transport system permease protein [Blastocatellia bacterium]